MQNLAVKTLLVAILAACFNCLGLPTETGPTLVQTPLPESIRRTNWVFLIVKSDSAPENRNSSVNRDFTTSLRTLVRAAGLQLAPTEASAETVITAVYLASPLNGRYYFSPAYPMLPNSGKLLETGATFGGSLSLTASGPSPETPIRQFTGVRNPPEWIRTRSLSFTGEVVGPPPPYAEATAAPDGPLYAMIDLLVEWKGEDVIDTAITARDVPVRAAAAHWIRQNRRDQFAPVLASRIDATFAGESMLQALAELNRELAVQAAVAALNRGWHSGVASRTLMRFDAREGAPALANALSRASLADPAILDAIDFFGDYRSMNALIAFCERMDAADILGFQDPMFKRAVESMKRISHKDFGTNITAWKNWWRSNGPALMEKQAAERQNEGSSP